MAETCSGAATDAGQRPTNEDAVYAFERDGPNELASRGKLYMVADGVGGQEGGQTASRLAVSIVAESYYDSPPGDPRANLISAVKNAHRVLHTVAG